MVSYKLFIFYFSFSFVLLFGWMDLSRGDVSQQISDFNEFPPASTVQKHTHPQELINSDVQTPENSTNSFKNPSDKSSLPLSVSSPASGADSLTSAPEKIVMEILTANPPPEPLIQAYNSIVSSPKIEPLITPVRLELVDDRIEPRGKMTMELVSLVVPLASISESVKVLLHELAHVVDLQYLKPGMILGDPSEKFYAISWVDMSTKKPGMAIQDFVSGYAMTNKYEDFGESFTFFLFHNQEFAKRAKQSKALAEKYAFFQKYVFLNQEFIGTGFEVETLPKYSWDTTKIPVAINKYLFYIK